MVAGAGVVPLPLPTAILHAVSALPVSAFPAAVSALPVSALAAAVSTLAAVPALVVASVLLVRALVARLVFLNKKEYG